jgi:hypothetical protein
MGMNLKKRREISPTAGENEEAPCGPSSVGYQNTAGVVGKGTVASEVRTVSRASAFVG